MKNLITLPDLTATRLRLSALGHGIAKKKSEIIKLKCKKLPDADRNMPPTRDISLTEVPVVVLPSSQQVQKTVVKMLSYMTLSHLNG